MSDEVVLKLSNKLMRRLSYMMGCSEAANGLVESAKKAAIGAENNVREMLSWLADQDGVELPADYKIKVDDETNQVIVTSNAPQMPFPKELTDMINNKESHDG